jgi:hypothetical protein
MSDLVRDLLQTYLFGDGLPTDLSDLAGAVDLGHPTDISRDRDNLLSDAVSVVR